jgi:hypothetical protein
VPERQVGVAVDLLVSKCKERGIRLVRHPGARIVLRPRESALNYLAARRLESKMAARQGMSFQMGVGGHEKCLEMSTKSAQVSGVSQP